MDTDKYLEIGCHIVPLDAWPIPDAPLSKIGPGTYLVGRDVTPGIYRGEAGTEVRDSCYWARLSGVSGDSSDTIANDIAKGQFYVEVMDTDKYLEIGCHIVPLDAWPIPDAPLSKIGPGTYLVGRDVTPGIYRGEAGTEVRDSCYWARLSGVSGDSSDTIANDIAKGQFYVEVMDTDKYLEIGCHIVPLDAWPIPDAPLSKIGPGTYLVGRDVTPGIYRGEAGTEVRDSCYWARLSGVSGDSSDTIANDIAKGQFYVEVMDTDKYLEIGCHIVPLCMAHSRRAAIQNRAWHIPSRPRCHPGNIPWRSRD